MAGGFRYGGIALLPLIRKHERAVEKDFALMGVDYRDRFKPGGGPSRLTTRRLLLLVDALDRFTSHFWSEAGDYDRVSAETIAITDIWGALAGNGAIHPLRNQREQAARAAKREKDKRAIREASRLRKRLRQAS